MATRFSGVVTTGIYCREGCPAQPKRENVRGYDFAAAAEADGFRPCLRCRPDRAPGWSDWLGPSELVCRALHLIGQGALDGVGVDDLAARLGVGPRHLRRLFLDHVGASPVAIAKSRRAHFARRLLDETDVSVTDIAFAAGFNSVRQFNRTMLEVFRYPPSGLRERRRRDDRITTDGGLSVRLAYRPPLDWIGMARYLAARATPGVESVDEWSYRRTIEWDGHAGVLELRPDCGDSHLVLTVHLPQLAGLIHVVEQARRIFDLGADPATIERALAGDVRLRPLVGAHPGLRVPGTWDPYEVAVRAVLGQQISVPAATTLAGRLAASFGTPLPTGDPALAHVFPSPAVLADADVASIGLPAARAHAIGALSAAVADGHIVLDGSLGLDELTGRLRQLPGIGDWTAQYVAMRACGEPDAFPAGDLGLRRAATHGARAMTSRELEAQAEPWRPWRAYAAMHLWMSSARMSGNGETARAARVTTSV